MTTIDRTKLQAIRADLEKALITLSKEHGVVFNLGTLRFDSQEAHGKLTITAAHGAVAVAIGGAADGPQVTQRDLKEITAAEAYRRHCQEYGLAPEWLDQRIVLSGGTFTLIGLLPNKHKNVVLIKRVSTGKNFIASADAIILAQKLAGAGR